MDSLLGTSFGPYEMLAVLGRGGMGEVYRARDTRLNRTVAIKFLAAEMADVVARRRFQQEAQTASSLNHPHILTVFEAGESDGRQYLVTEFIDGGTLKDWAHGQKRTWRQIVELLTGVADGLAAAHAAGIMHRDVKPANILVAKNGYAKLGDFGLAKLADPEDGDRTRTLIEPRTRQGVIVGTVAYMSPEQASGQPLDARTDIFSFGVVLSEAVSGQRPFAATSDALVMQAIIHETAAPLGGEIPLALRLIVEKALEKDPADRYQSMREMVVDLRRLTRAKTEVASAAFTDPQSERRPRRWGRVAGIAAAILVVAAGVTWRLWEHDYFWQNPLDGSRPVRLTDFEGEEVDAAISPDGKFMVFVSDKDGPLDVFRSQIGSGEVESVTKGLFQPPPWGMIRDVGFSGDGSQVWFLQTRPGPVLDFSTWQVPAMGGVPRLFSDHTLNPIWSPDGKTLAYHTPDPGDPIFLADRNASNPKQIFIASPEVHCHFLTWSPDGRYIYFALGTPTTDMDIWRIPAARSETAATPERITAHHAWVAYPAWLDSRTLIYSATAEDGSGRWLYGIDVEHRIPHRVSSGIAEQYLSVAVDQVRPHHVVATVANPTASLWTVPISNDIQTEAAVKPVATFNTRALSPRFGPDYLTFLSSKGGADGLWKLDNNASTAQELWKGDEGGVVAPAAISRDGTQICFSYRKQGRAGLYVINANGTNLHALAESFDVQSAASWSRDGKWVAVAANQGAGTRMFKVPVSGGRPVRLRDTFASSPVWSPDGTFIVYSEQSTGGQVEVRAVTPDQVPVPMAALAARRFRMAFGTPYRFTPNGRALITLEGPALAQNFFRVDLDGGQRRQLTDLKPGSVIQDFDVSPDGTRIVFDRLRNHADIVLMTLAR